MEEAQDALAVDWRLYFLPLLALIPRVVIIVRFFDGMSTKLSDEERDSPGHRALILSLAGFCFSAGIALPAYGAATNADVYLPTYFVLIGFLCCIAALHIQAFKYDNLRDQIGSGLVDSAILCLIASVVSMTVLIKSPSTYFCIIATVAISIWILDTGARMSIWWKNLSAEEKNRHANARR